MFHVYSMQDQFAALHENPDLYVSAHFAFFVQEFHAILFSV